MTNPSPHAILQQYWGYPTFRPLQEAIIQSVLDGRDSLALLPTGGGKSLCYQVPALCREGICLVVSPLVALMKDQVQNLKGRGVPAAAIFSGMSRREMDIVFENACNGGYKLLYLSPERLQTELARARIQRMKVSLLAVDEAHCISQWGYDFRPPYLQIAQLRPLLPPGTPILALTATATADVMADISEKLAFRDAQVFQQSFARPNLSYSLLYESKKREKMLDILRRVPGAGIVYARSRGETKEIAHFLQRNGISADFYHAGLSGEERSSRQDAWMRGNTRIIACTNAFGMGIDKPDVRVVVHLNLPDSLEAYFQEAGRAGRDGQKAYATLLYTPGDADTLRFHLKAAYPPPEMVARVYQAIGSHTQLAVGAGLGETFDFDLQQFCAKYRLEQAPTHAALRVLEQEGWIALGDTGGTAPKVHISATREQLYDYQLRHPQADALIKVLLRAYPGINAHFCDISENLVAQYAKMPTETVQQLLLAAAQAEILAYEPAKDKPQLTLTRERVASGNLQLDHKRLLERRNKAEFRMESAIRYAEARQCRSQLLLAYFGEEDSKRCGICDVCTGRNKNEVSVENFEGYERKIRDVLRQEALPVEELLKAFAPKRHDMVAQVVGYLLDEGKLAQLDSGALRWADGN
jgi:ATP-dependent DNA helicase RecQ